MAQPPAASQAGPDPAWLETQDNASAAYLAALPLGTRIEQRLAEIVAALAAGQLPDSSLTRALRALMARGADASSILEWATRADDQLIAYTVADGRSGGQAARIYVVDGGCDLPDVLYSQTIGDLTWAPDGRGFFYSAQDGAQTGWLLAYHELGTAQAADICLWQRPDQPTWQPLPAISSAGDYLIITVIQSGDIRNLVLVKDLGQPDAAPIELVGAFDGLYAVIGNSGPIFWLRLEDHRQPRGIVVAVNCRRPQRAHWQEIIAEQALVLRSAALDAQHLICHYLRDVSSELHIHTLAGQAVGVVKLPADGWVSEIEPAEGGWRFCFSTPTTPPAWLRYDIRTGSVCVEQPTCIPTEIYDPATYCAYRRLYETPDGTRVPIWISHRRDLALDGSHPAYLTAYGGFNVVPSPAFNPEAIPWMELGGVYAVAHVRGGGEYGRAWHQAAIGQRKHISRDDLLAAAEWLIGAGYTTAALLAIGGQSNGGLVVGACLTRRPNLFGAAIIHSGVLDLLHIEQLGRGYEWASEYGSPHDPRTALALADLSPLHTLAPGAHYPATLIITARHDPIVGELHSQRFAAALQAAQGGPAPVLLWHSRATGHGERALAESTIDVAMRWAFIAHELGIEAAAQPDAGALREIAVAAMPAATVLHDIVARASTLAERQASHADDAGLPSWALLLAECLAVGDPLPERCCEASDPLPFEDIALLFVAGAAVRLRKQSPSLAQNIAPAAQAALERQLLRQLVLLLAQPLQLEFALFRARHQTRVEHLRSQIGPPATHHYAAFITHLRQGGLVPFFNEYSVLARLLATTALQWIEATAELLARLAADRSALARTFGCTGAPLGMVAAIEPGLSDPHHGGRCVATLQFASGLRVVYKPRPLDLEQGYGALLDWCADHGLRPALLRLAVVARPGYGWVEYVVHEPCPDRAAVERYYQRAGILLGLMYVLGATDCHRDNLIASGEHPVIVDLEVLLVPLLPGAEPGSVIDTLLLPSIQGDLPGAMLSGFGTGAPGSIERRPQWRNINTDAMALLEEDRVVSPAIANLPYLNLTPAPPEEWAAAMGTGFDAIYAFLLAHREELLADTGPLARLVDHPTRVVLRHTAGYCAILDSLRQPRLLRDGAVRSQHLAALCEGPAPQPPASQIARAEQIALERMDVPYAAMRPSSSTLELEGGQQIVDFALASGGTLLAARLRSLSAADAGLQCAILTMSLQPDQPRPQPPSPWHSVSACSQTGLVAAARQIGAELERRALALPTGGRGWLELAYDPRSQGYQPQLVGLDLYAGRSGIALFLSQLAAQTSELAWGDLAMQTLPAPAEVRAAHGGVIYALVRCAQLLHAPHLLERACAVAGQLTPAAIAAEPQVDCVAGSAGTLLGLLKLHSATQDPAVLRQATLCGEQILGRQMIGPDGQGAWPGLGGRCLTGFAHGAAGIAYALLQLYEAGQDLRFLHAAGAALAYERSVFAPERGNWPDLRSPDGGFENAWCHGAPGIALARLGSLTVLDTPAERAEIDVALATTSQDDGLLLDHLCCGRSGRIEALLVASQTLKRPDLLAAAQRKAALLLAQAHTGAWAVSHDLHGAQVPGLFSGLAGIGYTFLRLADPESIPSVLLLG